MVRSTLLVVSSFTVQQAPMSQPERDTRKGFLSRLRTGLGRTREAIAGGLADLLGRPVVVDDDLLDEIETILLSADVGIEPCQQLMHDLRQRVARKEAHDGAAVMAALKRAMVELLTPVEAPLTLPAPGQETQLILMVGINGAGKTTTIGKLAQRFKREGRSVMLAAGDTFRAAAIEQLERWGERNDVPVVAQHSGADSASVVFDAFQSAKARGVDLLLADTAGRLHTQVGLMDELKKVRRVAAKLDANAPQHVLLVLDASIGQNAILQAEQFHAAVGVTGLVITKLDGTAKGGVVFAIAAKLALPVHFIGVGESADDLREFEAEAFVDALLGDWPAS